AMYRSRSATQRYLTFPHYCDEHTQQGKTRGQHAADAEYESSHWLCALTFAFCRAALSAKRRGRGVGQQRAVRRHAFEIFDAACITSSKIEMIALEEQVMAASSFSILEFHHRRMFVGPQDPIPCRPC